MKNFKGSLLALAISAALITQPVMASSAANLSASEGVSATQTSTSWVEKSNQYAQLVLDMMTKYAPESAASMGVEGFDEEIMDLKPGFRERANTDTQALVKKLEKALTQEVDAKVQQDLEILIQTLKDNLVSSDLNDQYMLTYFDLAQNIFFGVQSLLDPQTEASRKQAVVTRIKRYAGEEKGYQPITELAKQITTKALKNKSLVGPFTQELSSEIENSEKFINGMKAMLEASGLDGWQAAFGKFETQLRDYYQWLDKNVGPRVRSEPMLPQAIYENNLKNFGVDWNTDKLISNATLAFANIRNEMDSLASIIASKNGYASADYRDVIRELKKQRVQGDKVLDFYKSTLKDLERIIEERHLVTLPKRNADIKIADEARSAAIPAPHVQPPRLVGNTGEYPVFMIPQILKNDDGSWKHNDTTFEANAMTLTAHEARPGHELQFSSMMESGVSTTRALFAFNSANVEGWALYAEAISKPYMPLEAQLISLQNRLLRAARMYLDPMINTGQISRDEAKRVLMDEVVLDDGFAQSEIDRYSFRSPGQATAYYYGYSHLQSLRTHAELKLKEKFVAKDFHDFILAQGLMSPAMLKAAVFEDFVPKALAK